MSTLVGLCRNATTFSKTGELNEDAFRQFLQRFVDAKIGVYIASGGSGEGHALTWEELRRVYQIGVEVCKGKVQVNANLPEQSTARATIEHARLAIESGVEIVNIYGPSTLHGYRPREREYLAYHDTILSAIKHPIALAPNPSIGYTPKPAVIADLCHKYHQVVAVNLASLNASYFVALKDRLSRDVALNVTLDGTPITLALGAAGIIGGDFNIIPKTLRRYLDLYESKKFDELAIVYAEIERCAKYLRDPRWFASSPRGIKMAMKVLKLPGGEGGVREPYLMPLDEEVEEFADGLLRLRVPEIQELARAAGLSIPT